jgi:caa(3)-type oxidase subunit IV
MSEHPHDAARGHHPNYVRVWAILTLLLLVSVTGPTLGIRVVTLIAAFGVALVKAYLVARNFMHLNVERPIVHWALGTVLILMVLLYAGVAPDVQKSRGQRWEKDGGFHYMSAQARGAGESHPAPPRSTGDGPGTSAH